MRIAVQLVSVTDGYHLWSERFDRELVDVFAVQDEIAAAIAAKLQVTFIPPTQPAGKATTAEVEAFELVAKGRTLAQQRGRSLLAARECLERAIALDPQNADAYAALGETLVNFVRYGLLPLAEARPLIRSMLERAIELDPQMATVMGSLASVSLLLEHDPDTAFRWWERALEAQPRLVEIRAQYAIYGLMCLRHDDARGMAELARAVRDDPRSAYCAVFHSLGLLGAGRASEAAAEAQRAYDLDPHSFLTLYARTFVLSLAGEADGALAAANTAFAVIGRSPWVLMGLPNAYVQRGARSLGEAVYTELQARSQTELVSRMVLAFAADHLGRVDEAIAYAIESVDCCDNLGPFFTLRPFFGEAFHAHPRYPELLRAIGL